MSEAFQGLQWDQPSWTLIWWTGTGFHSIKLCRTLDGRFGLDGTTLPLWGRLSRTFTRQYEVDPQRQRTRTTVEHRVWIPYIMLWSMTNTHDHDVVEVPADDPRLLNQPL